VARGPTSISTGGQAESRDQPRVCSLSTDSIKGGVWGAGVDVPGSPLNADRTVPRKPGTSVTTAHRLAGQAAPRPHAPDFDRAGPIGEFYGYSESRTLEELLIDGEEDRTLRAVLVGMLRELTGSSADRRPRAASYTTDETRRL
jgi:hypothetical protein